MRLRSPGSPSCVRQNRDRTRMGDGTAFFLAGPSIPSVPPTVLPDSGWQVLPERESEQGCGVPRKRPDDTLALLQSANEEAQGA